MNERQASFIRWLPILYLSIITSFHFDAWYHFVVGRDEFWIIPHVFVLTFQLVHTLLVFLIILFHERTTRRASPFFPYLLLQLVFFLGLIFDDWWHQLFGEERIDTAWVVFGPPHLLIAAPLIVTPFLLENIIQQTFHDSQRTVLLAFTFGGLLAWMHLFFTPFWPLGPYRLLTLYGEIIMLALLGFVFWWGYRAISVPWRGSLIILIFLSLAEIMSWGKFTDIPRIHDLFSVPVYPFWLTFFSFFFASVLVDGIGFLKIGNPLINGALWGSVQSSLYALGAKLWVDLSPSSLFEGWKFFPGITISWTQVVELAGFGLFGGMIGFLFADILFKKVWRNDHGDIKR